MTFAIVELHKQLSDLSEPSTQLVNAFASIEERSGRNGIVYIARLFEEARSEIRAGDFRNDQTRESTIDQLTSIEQVAFKNISTRNGTATGPLLNPDTLSILESVSNLIQNITTKPQELDRLELTESIKATRREIPIDDQTYFAKSVRIALNLAEQMSAKGEFYDDLEIRTHIKRLVADFSIEFEIMDSDYRTRWEKARKHLIRLGIVGSGAATMLSLGVDLANATLLLTDQS